jgi:hypothetical protein
MFTELGGLSMRAAAAELDKRAIPTPTGVTWSAVAVMRVRERLGMAA